MSSYDRDRAAYEQFCTEEMIRMRTPQPAQQTVVIQRADISASGPIDGTGAKSSDGSYVLIHILPDGREPQKFRISRGGAEQLEAELHGVLRVDVDRLTGSVIDAYTLAPNDEEAKRDAVREAIERVEAMNTDPQPASTMAPLLDAITGSGGLCFRDGMTVAELEARCRKLAARCGRYPTVTASIGQSDRYLTVWANAACHRFFSAKPDFETAFTEADAWLASQSVPPEWWDMPELAA